MIDYYCLMDCICLTVISCTILLNLSSLYEDIQINSLGLGYLMIEGLPEHIVAIF